MAFLSLFIIIGACFWCISYFNSRLNAERHCAELQCTLRRPPPTFLDVGVWRLVKMVRRLCASRPSTDDRSMTNSKVSVQFTLQGAAVRKDVVIKSARIPACYSNKYIRSDKANDLSYLFRKPLVAINVSGFIKTHARMARHSHNKCIPEQRSARPLYKSPYSTRKPIYRMPT